jgi:uncharacterized protein
MLTRKIGCPICNAPVKWGPESAYRPFCSARCKEIDLGAWANDEYRIPSESPLDPGDLEVDSSGT